MKFRRLEIVGSTSLVLAITQIVAQVALNEIFIDTTTLILLGIASVGFALPELLSDKAGLKKFRLGQFEIEFEERLREAEESIVRAEQNEHDQKNNDRHHMPPLERIYVEEYERVISSPVGNREKIILGGLLLERMAAETARHLEIETAGLHSAKDFVRALREGDFISNSEVDAFDSFWKVRNLAVHSSKDDLTNEQTLRLLDLLWRLVRVFG